MYDLAGNQLYFYFDGNYNNVDLRYNFPLGAESVALVGVSNRTDPISLEFYKVNVADRSLTSVGEIPLDRVSHFTAARLRDVPFARFGEVLHLHHRLQHKRRVPVRAERLNGLRHGHTGASFDNGNTSEGMVTDDHLQRLYVSEEDVGIWRYGAEPGDGATRVLMDSIVASGGHLVNNVKNTAIYYKSGGGGYLVASSQGSGGSFQIYNRVDNAFVGEFKVTNGINGVDGVNGQDGIDLTNFNLGPGVSSRSLRDPGPRQHQRRQREQREPELQVRPLAVHRQRVQPRRCRWTTISIRVQSAASGGSPTPVPTGPTPTAIAHANPTPTPTPSPVPTATPANQVAFNPTDDAYIAGDLPANNFGSAAVHPVRLLPVPRDIHEVRPPVTVWPDSAVGETADVGDQRIRRRAEHQSRRQQYLDRGYSHLQQCPGTRRSHHAVRSRRCDLSLARIRPDLGCCRGGRLDSVRGNR